MDKNTYLQYKIKGDTTILYQYYLEHYDSNKHKFLSNAEFQTYIRMWANPLNVLFQKICSEYDQKFNIVTIFNKEGQPIAYA
jgi:hypothetical protein